MLRLFLLSAFLTCIFISIPSATEIPAGPVSGDWYATGNPYNINGEITVDSGSTLNIHPGVDVIFQGHFKFKVYGYLNAIGTESDSILFTAADTAEGWHGIRFINAPDSSYLYFCIIEYGEASGGQYPDPDILGGGIYCIDSNPNIIRCKIQYNHAHSGGGIYCIQSNPLINNCNIINNEAGQWHYSGNGAAIYCNNCSPIISDCISDNTSHSTGAINCVHEANPLIYNCTIQNNRGGWSGGGIYCDDFSSPAIIQCNITGNGVMAYGGGLYIGENCSPIIQYCTISYNFGNNSAIYLDNSDNPSFYHCQIYGNYDLSPTIVIGCNNSEINIINCTICDNYGTVITFGYDHSSVIYNTIIADNYRGISFNSNSQDSILYCDIYNNEMGNFLGPTPPGLGVIDTVNNNGDPCDQFMNIFLDPQFIDPGNYDFHLQAGSPCIDAGNPNSNFDPDSTIADIGAFFFDQSWVKDPREIPHPTEFRLSQNYPNPFNPITIIPFQYPYTTHVSLKIYNILGQKVATLIDNRLSSGHHTVTFDATHLPSGIYFYELTTTNFQDIKKMILIK